MPPDSSKGKLTDCDGQQILLIFKDDLIGIIEWYRDEYHKKDFGHSKLIERVRKATTWAEFNSVEQTVDGWLDSRDY